MENLAVTVTAAPVSGTYTPSQEEAMELVRIAENNETGAHYLYCIAVLKMKLEFDASAPLSRGATGGSGRSKTSFWQAVESGDAGVKIQEADKRTIRKWVEAGSFALSICAAKAGKTEDETMKAVLCTGKLPAGLVDDLPASTMSIYVAMSDEQRLVFECARSANGGKPPGKHLAQKIKNLDQRSEFFAHISQMARGGKIAKPGDFDRALREAQDLKRAREVEEAEAARQAALRAEEEAAKAASASEVEPEQEAEKTEEAEEEVKTVEAEVVQEGETVEVTEEAEESADEKRRREKQEYYLANCKTASVSASASNPKMLEHLSRWSEPLVTWCATYRGRIHNASARLTPVLKDCMKEWGSHHTSYELDWELMDLLPPEVMGESWVKAFTVGKDKDGNPIIDRKAALRSLEMEIRVMADRLKTIRENTAFMKGEFEFTVTP